MKSQSGYQTVTVKVLANISRSKGNQTMKFGQLVEYNMRNIFLGKSYVKCGGKTNVGRLLRILRIFENTYFL